MGLFEHFPYTNFHELNLGWFLDKFKALLAEWGIYQPIFEGIRDEAEAAAEDAAEALAAAETAQGAAETALAQANTAITTANTAVTEAQTARNAAVAAQAGAEAARAGAETAQTGAEAALADAVAAKNAAQAAQTAAEAANTAAQGAKTAAETAQAAAEDVAEDAQEALAGAVEAKNAAVAAQIFAETAANRAEAAVAVDVELRVVWDNTNSEIDTTQNPVIVSGTYLDLYNKLNTGTQVKIRVYSNYEETTGTPAFHRVVQHIYPVPLVSLSNTLITIGLYYWSGNPSSTSKSYTILWNSSGITIAPVQ